MSVNVQNSKSTQMTQLRAVVYVPIMWTLDTESKIRGWGLCVNPE